ncbi:MAG: hypothetical protein AB7N76_32575 [Planctomycetota bacterium]
MSDRELRAVLRAWREGPDDETLAAALAAPRRAREDLPWDLLAASPRWARVCTTNWGRTKAVPERGPQPRS